MLSSWWQRRRGEPPRRTFWLIASVMVVVGVYGALLAGQATARPGSSTTRAPVEPCAALAGLSLPDGGSVANATDVPASGGIPQYCSVGIQATYDADPRGGQSSVINIALTLPDTNWNGNYMAEGGGVYCSPDAPATDQLAAGYATSTVDCGHAGTSADPQFPNALISPWVCQGYTSATPACTPDGGLNWNRIDTFGYLSEHLMAVESKAVINAYYGAAPGYSFWNGCSTGGRQGLSEAEKYPTDFNGILAGAPALNWDQFMVAQMWPQLVMEWNSDELSTCKEDLVNTTLQSQCRDQDGQIDGVFDPRACDVLKVLRSLIGTSTPCGTFTATDALVVQEIWQGPRFSGSQSNLLTGVPVWFGMEPGADLAGAYVPFLGPGGGLGLATTFQTSSGTWAGAPFIPSDDWFQKWLKEDPSWVFTDETYQQYWHDFLKSGRMFDYALADDNPNLSAFRRAGGKLLMWQGLADQLIFTGDSINFYNEALGANGGIRSTEQFFRYFLAPGVAHCGTPGAGSVAPTDPMQAVVNWVETGQAPDVLPASGTINGQAVTRPLCPYPDPDAVYTGGDPNQAGSYTCRNVAEFTNPLVPGPVRDRSSGRRE
jgi:hypothetical protein